MIRQPQAWSVCGALIDGGQSMTHAVCTRQRGNRLVEPEGRRHNPRQPTFLPGVFGRLSAIDRRTVAGLRRR